MRIIRFEDPQGQVHYGMEPQTGQLQVQRLSGDLYAGLNPTNQFATMAKLLAPVDPVNIFCVGVNYAAHAKESGMDPQERPVFFMKATSSLNHPYQPIRIPACQINGPEVDYEAELAVVIGRRAHNVSTDEALSYVLGYTCGHDVSARRWQKQGSGGQWVRGKSFDTFCPLGPVLVTADEIPDPQNLAIRCLVNGQIMQQDNTASMTFTVARLIHLLSQDTTLLPGTVILTGTPEGVGFARKPPVFLQPGDEVVVEVEGIGSLRNPVAAAV